jgi:hypothetical protein
MLIIPLQAAPSQILNTVLAEQAVTLRVYQRFYGLFIDLLVDDVLIVGGVICQNLNRIVRSVYLAFDGDFIFIDNQGETDPVYTGLGIRYSLAYLSSQDLADLGFDA